MKVSQLIRIVRSKGSPVIRAHVLYMLILWGCVLIWLLYPRVKEYYFVRKVEAMHDAGDPQAELRALEQLVRNYPKDKYREMLSTAFALEAHQLNNAGHNISALNALDRAFGVMPDNPRVFASYASILVDQQELCTADFMLRRAAYYDHVEYCDNVDTCDNDITMPLLYRDGTHLYFKLARSAAVVGEWELCVRNFDAWNRLASKYPLDQWAAMSPVEKATALRDELNVMFEQQRMQHVVDAFETLQRASGSAGPKSIKTQ